MRRRLLVSTVGVTVAVLLVLVLPILIVLRDSAQREEQRRLEREADRMVAELEVGLDAGRTPNETTVLASSPPGVHVIVSTLSGDIVVAGPDVGDNVVRASAVTEAGARIELSSRTQGMNDRLSGDIVSLGLLVLVGVAAAAALSIVQSRRLARPFEQLAQTATRFGNGDFSATIPTTSGVPELDNIGKALSASATRLDQMFVAERSFTGDATHQLRTGLTGISLRLEMLAMSQDESVRAEANAALAQTEQLDHTIDELLELARKGRAEHRVEFDLDALVGEHVRDWQRAFGAKGRTVQFVVSRSRAVATPGFAGQVVDLLLSNSLEHGAGTTLVRMLPNGVQVSDDGEGVAVELVPHLFDQPSDPGAAHGRGLPLARRLAEADGGVLDLLDPHGALFRYLLPTTAGVLDGPTT